MQEETRTGTMATVQQREALTSAHHHTALLRADVTAVVGIGALLWILGLAFAISWRHSGDGLRGILSEFDDHGTPPAEQGSGVQRPPSAAPR